MKFSVLLSVYVKEKAEHLKESLESITTNQTMMPNEIIIVKDGKLNNNLEMVLSYYEKQFPKVVKCIGYKNNSGLGFALNFGLKHCSNELIFRMDTDDIAVSNRFEKQLIFYKLRPNLALIGGYLEEFENKSLKSIGLKKCPLEKSSIKSKLKVSNPFNHPTVMFRKSIIQSIGGYSDEFLGFEDYELWARLIKSGHETANIPEVLVKYRVTNAQLYRRKGINYMKKELKLIKQLYELRVISRIEAIKKLIISGFIRLLPNSLFKIAIKIYRRQI